MVECETRTQGARIAALVARPRTQDRADQRVRAARASFRCEFVALEVEQAPLVLGAVGAVGAETAGGDDAMARDEDREVAARAEASGGARGTGRTGERRELAVGDDLAARDRPERGRAAGEEPSLVGEVDRHRP